MKWVKSEMIFIQVHLKEIGEKLHISKEEEQKREHQSLLSLHFRVSLSKYLHINQVYEKLFKKMLATKATIKKVQMCPWTSLLTMHESQA